MGSFPETYDNGPNRLRSKRRLYSTQARKTFRSSFARKLERESSHEKKNEGGGGGKKRKRFPANPTIL